MPQSYLGYFIDRKDLPGIFVDCGGNLQGLSEKSMELTHIIRRSIFRYLMPARVRVYFDAAVIDGETITGITFKIGKDNDTLGMIPKDLLRRCDDIFTYPPDTFVRQDPHKYRYEWRRGTEIKGVVTNLDFLESNLNMNY